MKLNETLYRIEIAARYGDPRIEQLRALGCQWDGQARVWWIGRREPAAAQVRALAQTSDLQRISFARECERRRAAGLGITVPYDARHIAKAHGGIWDGRRKQWLMPSQVTAQAVLTQVGPDSKAA